MTAEEFLAGVQAALGIGELQSALEASRATLQALSECVPQAAAQALARHLPPEFAHFIEGAHGHAGQCSRNAFIARVSEREGLDAAAAEGHVRAVLGVLTQALPPQARKGLREALPADCRDWIAHGP